MIAPSAWLPYSRVDGSAGIRLFCFPSAGAGASIYNTWTRDFPGAIQVCPVQLPGRETRFREPRYRRLEPLIEALSAALVPYLDRPFALFGHSMGALLGYALAVHLDRIGGPAARHLFVAARGAPHLPPRGEARADLSDAELARSLRDLHGVSEQVLDDAGFMRMLLPIFRDDFAVCETYVDGDAPQVSSPIAAFGGLDDTGVSPADLEAWRERTSGTFALHMLPGDHFFLRSCRRRLQQLICETLAA